MITKRMLALAAALLLAYPAYGLAQDVYDVFEGMWDDPNDAIEYGHDVAMYVEDIDLVDLQLEKNQTPWQDREEQLVEGHTVFATLERTVTFDDRRGTYNLSGFVRCDYVADGEFNFTGPFGIVPVPRRIDRAGIECSTGHSVIITPGAYNTSHLPSPPMSTTGVLVPFETPFGTTGYAEELVFSIPSLADDGTLQERTYTAWRVPVIDPWVDELGRVRNLWMSLPTDKLVDNGADRYDVIPAYQAVVVG